MICRGLASQLFASANSSLPRSRYCHATLLPTSGEERCVTRQITAAWETRQIVDLIFFSARQEQRSPFSTGGGGGGGGLAPGALVCRGSGAILRQKILKSKCRPRKKCGGCPPSLLVSERYPESPAI